jgi:hypothetical protein
MNDGLVRHCQRCSGEVVVGKIAARDLVPQLVAREEAVRDGLERNTVLHRLAGCE